MDGGFVTGDVFVGLLLGVFPIIISLAVDGATESWMAYPRHLEIVLTKGSEPKKKDAAVEKTGTSTKSKNNGSKSKGNASKSKNK